MPSQKSLPLISPTGRMIPLSIEVMVIWTQNRARIMLRNKWYLMIWDVVYSRMHMKDITLPYLPMDRLEPVNRILWLATE